MAEQTAVSHDISKLVDKIKDIRIAMMTTVESDGTLHSRPMFTHEPQADGTLWFFTEQDSQKINEVQKTATSIWAIPSPKTTCTWPLAARPMW